MCASIVMRSIESGNLAACPWEDLAPFITWMAERTLKKQVGYFNHRVVALVATMSGL